ncbi:addiction module toxin RelE [Spirochaetia bacterium]|nr:addiction module toxin RelE [Spirochaetia bacterium]
MYTLAYLPSALSDLDSIVTYIGNDLDAPKTAAKLRLEFDRKILALTKNPLRHRIYFSHDTLKFEYRKLPVKNYSVFYVVKEDLVEIHRVLYSRRDIGAVLKNEEE